jgi:hypothetical protein
MESSFAQILSNMRKEPCLKLALPVKIFTQAPMPEWSCTYEISRSGARVKQVEGVQAGQQIWLQRNSRKAKYRVVWIGQPETLDAGQMGVERMEERVIWDDEIQGRLL